MKLKLLTIFVLSLFMLTACTEGTGSDAANADDFPFNLIHEKFGLAPFDIPEGWEVVGVSQQLKPIRMDVYNPENSEFEDYPQHVYLAFGTKTAENEAEDEWITKHNEQNKYHGQQMLYLHSEEKTIAWLHINQQYEKKPITDYEDVVQPFLKMYELNNRTILVVGEDPQLPLGYSWTSSDERLLFHLMLNNSTEAPELDFESMKPILEKLMREHQ